MDVKELLEESVIKGIWDEEEKTWCVVIPKDIFTHIVEHLIPRDVDEDE